MTITIVDKQHITNDAWDSFVINSSQAWFWHSTDFLNTFATWRGAHDISFAMLDSKSQQLLGICQLSLFAPPQQKYTAALANFTKAQVKKLINLASGKSIFSLQSHSASLFSLGGFALQAGVSSKCEKQILQCLENHIRSLCALYNASASLSLSSLAPAFTPGSCPLINPLLFIGCQNTLSQTWVVDLSPPVEQIFKQCSETTRQEVRKVAKANLTVREAMGEKDFATYYALHQETYARTAATPHPPEYFHSIFTHLAPKKMCRILFLEEAGRVIAANNSIFYKNAGYYWTSASVTEKVNGLNKYLLYQQILYAKKQGYRFFETGEAFPHIRSGKLMGLNTFKKSFGGSLHPLYRGMLTSESA